jgi:hypothetical protein
VDGRCRETREVNVFTSEIDKAPAERLSYLRRSRLGFAQSAVLSPAVVKAQTLNDDDQPCRELGPALTRKRSQSGRVVGAQFLEHMRVRVHRVVVVSRG